LYGFKNTLDVDTTDDNTDDDDEPEETFEYTEKTQQENLLSLFKSVWITNFNKLVLIRIT